MAKKGVKKKEAAKAKRREFLSFERAIFLLVVIALLVIIKAVFAPPQALNPEDGEDKLAREAEIVLYTLTEEQAELSLLESNKLEEDKIRKLEQAEYEEIKDMLGLKSDFCVFFEDTSGNLVKIGGIGSGIGSDRIQINGEPCR
ncbi:hypothetical protein KY347_01575 [Candidatus Woesearchaeota archaeon]|nr:hypothetical protein [Candidatus Woesearchaeota archaeon]